MIPEGYPSHVSLYDVCVGMALVSEQAREALKNKDSLFAEIYAFGEGKGGEEWKTLIRTLLGDQNHPAGADAQGDWTVGKKRFSRLFQAVIHRLLSIGGFASLRLEQRKAASIQRALSAVIESLSMSNPLELPDLTEHIVASTSRQHTSSKTGLPMPGDGVPTHEKSDQR